MNRVPLPTSKPLGSYKGHTIWVDYDYEDDNRKAWHYVQKPGDNKVVIASITPYDDSFDTICLWIDAGYPAYGTLGNSGNWDRKSLAKLLSQKQ